MSDWNEYADDHEFRVRLTGKSLHRCKAALEQVKGSFTYEPDAHMILNAMILTGRFSESDLVNHFRQVFGTPAEKSETFRARLTDETLAACRNMQRTLRRFFRYKPDVHMVVNAMISTGKFTARELTSHLTAAFTTPLEGADLADDERFDDGTEADTDSVSA